MTKLEELIKSTYPQQEGLPSLVSIEDLSYYLEDERKPEELANAYFELLALLGKINKEWE